MRLVHFSDLHIGIENYGRPATEADLAGLPEWFAPGEDRERYLGHSTRLLDFLSAFDELVAYTLANDVDLVMFSGDAYKNREPSQTHQREFAKRIARLAAANLPVFLLVGNHDLPHVVHKASAVEIFETLSVPQVTVGERLQTYRIETPNGPIQILALPWIRRSAFLARDDVRNLPFKQINELLEERLTARLQDEGEALDPTLPSVVSAHVSLDTAKIGTERTMMIGHDHLLLQGNLTKLPVDYIGLGHIHRRQELAQHPPTIYPGSLQRVDFGEEDHEAKGFYVVDLDPAALAGSRVTSAEFHPVDARSFVSVNVTAEEGDLDPTDKVVRAVRRHHVGGAIVRVQVTLPAAIAPAFRERDVREALQEQGAHSIAAITTDVERATRVRLGAIHSEAKSPLELLDFYLETSEVSKTRAKKLTTYARRLMDELEDKD
jgi:exonuclease SbcD